MESVPPAVADGSTLEPKSPKLTHPLPAGGTDQIKGKAAVKITASLSARNHRIDILVFQHLVKVAEISSRYRIQPLMQISQLGFEHRVHFLLLLVRWEVTVRNALPEVTHLADEPRPKARRVLTLTTVLALNQTVFDVG